MEELEGLIARVEEGGLGTLSAAELRPKLPTLYRATLSLAQRGAPSRST